MQGCAAYMHAGAAYAQTCAGSVQACAVYVLRGAMMEAGKALILKQLA